MMMVVLMMPRAGFTRSEVDGTSPDEVLRGED